MVKTIVAKEHRAAARPASATRNIRRDDKASTSTSRPATAPVRAPAAAAAPPAGRHRTETLPRGRVKQHVKALEGTGYSHVYQQSWTAPERMRGHIDNHKHPQAHMVQDPKEMLQLRAVQDRRLGKIPKGGHNDGDGAPCAGEKSGVIAGERGKRNHIVQNNGRINEVQQSSGASPEFMQMPLENVKHLITSKAQKAVQRAPNKDFAAGFCSDGKDQQREIPIKGTVLHPDAADRLLSRHVVSLDRGPEFMESPPKNHVRHYAQMNLIPDSPRRFEYAGVDPERADHLADHLRMSSKPSKPVAHVVHHSGKVYSKNFQCKSTPGWMRSQYTSNGEYLQNHVIPTVEGKFQAELSRTLGIQTPSAQERSSPRNLSSR